MTFEVNGEFDEYDDFLRGGDDHMGDFSDSIDVPLDGNPAEQTFTKKMVENVPNGGVMTLTYTVRFTPK